MDDPGSLKVGKLDMPLMAELLGLLPSDPSVILGPGVGCDVAVVDSGGSKYLLLKSDPITFATDEIALYAVTVNVNDIATTGGVPRWFLGTLLLPEHGTTPDLVRTIYHQLRSACARYGIVLVGGHTEVTYGLDRPLFCGALVGEVEKERLVTPRGAEPGDVVLLTKAVAVEGTSIIAREKRAELLAAGFCPDFLDRCARMLYDPGIGVLQEAQALCHATRVHAMHDPTEGGVATGLWELAVASGVGLRVELEAVPVYAETRQLCDYLELDPMGLIASGSLLAVVPPDGVASALEACAAIGVPCARIGRVVDVEEGCCLVSATGERELPRFDQDEITKLFA